MRIEARVESSIQNKRKLIQGRSLSHVLEDDNVKKLMEGFFNRQGDYRKELEDADLRMHTCKV